MFVHDAAVRRCISPALLGLAVLGSLLVAPPAPAATEEGPAPRVLVFVRDQQIHTATAAGTRVKRLTGSGRSFRPQWSPDGRRIAFVRENRRGERDLWVMRGNGSDKQRVTRLGDVSQPAWSPDGEWLAFGADGGPQAPHGVGGPLMRVSARAPFGTPEQLPMIGLEAELDGEEGSEELDPEVGYSLDWSADGERIVFDSYFNLFPAMSDDGWHTVVYDVASTEVRVVAGGCTGDARVGCRGPVHDPAWSPDGSFLVQTEKIDYYDDPNDHPRRPNLRFVDVDGPSPVAFPDVAGDRDAAFSPNGRWLVLTHGGALHRARVDGSARRRLTTGGQPDWR